MLDDLTSISVNQGNLHMRGLITFLETPVPPGSQLEQDYQQHIRRSDADTKSRLISALIATCILGWLTVPLFSVIWLGLVLINEFFVLKIRQRLARKGFVDYCSVFLTTINVGYGTVAWCVSAIYLSATGGIGHILLGVCIVIGVLTYAAFSKVSYANAVWVTLAPVVITLLAIPLILLARDVADLKSILSTSLGFAMVVLYFVSAIRQNFGVRAKLIDSLEDLSAANADLEEHRLHLSELVAERTRELNEEKIKLQQSLDHEKRLNEMQAQFVSMASHEFRTPLAIIDGSARRIERVSKRQGLDDVESRAESIRSAVSRMTSLLERTLDSSKLASGQLDMKTARFSIADQIRDVVQRQSELNPGFAFDLDLKDCPPTIEGDASLLETALTNVISNAMKYSGTIRKIAIRTSTKNEKLAISIRDSGIGILAKELSSISNRFFRSSNTAGIPGTGIGLNLVRTLVEMHDGRFRIASSEGEWTEVTLELPLQTDDLPGAVLA